MNERIKELAEQATEEVMRNTPSFLVTNEMWKEKFAELIVRECMSQIEEVRQIKAGNDEPVYTQGFEDGMFVAIRTVEEHFGVEE